MRIRCQGVGWPEGDKGVIGAQADGANDIPGRAGKEYVVSAYSAGIEWLRELDSDRVR